MRVTALPAFSDNYVYVLEGATAPEVAVVDPGDAAVVRRHLERTGARLGAILITHHHADHTGGVVELARAFPGVAVHGAAGDRARVPGLTDGHEDGAAITVCGRPARVLAVPGHTRGHVAYFFPGADGAGGGAEGGDVFTGDTIFAGTIGNLFEGTPEVMFRSLERVRALPPATRIWCGHEYTRLYLRDALAVEPDNAALAARVRAIAALPPDAPTVPFTLAEERATSPFFRWDEPALCARLGTRPGLETFVKVCAIT